MNRRLELDNNQEVAVERASKRDASRVAKDDNLCFENSHLSKRHALFKIDGGRVYIKDCFSAFGTVINTFFLRPGLWFEVEDGDRIGFIVAKPTSFINKIVSKVSDDSNTIPVSSFPGADIALKFVLRVNGNVLVFEPVDTFQGAGAPGSYDSMVANGEEMVPGDSPDRTTSPVSPVPSFLNENSGEEETTLDSEKDDILGSKPLSEEDKAKSERIDGNNKEKMFLEFDRSHEVSFTPPCDLRKMIHHSLEKAFVCIDDDEGNDSCAETSQAGFTLSRSVSSEPSQDEDVSDDSAQDTIINLSSDNNMDKIADVSKISTDDTQGSSNSTSNCDSSSSNNATLIEYAWSESEDDSDYSEKIEDDPCNQYHSDGCSSSGSDLSLIIDECCLQSSSDSELDSSAFSSEDEASVIEHLIRFDDHVPLSVSGCLVCNCDPEQQAVGPRKRKRVELDDDEDDDSEIDDKINIDDESIRKSLEVTIPYQPPSKRLKLEGQNKLSKIFVESLKGLCYVVATITALGIYGSVLESST